MEPNKKFYTETQIELIDRAYLKATTIRYTVEAVENGDQKEKVETEEILFTKNYYLEKISRQTLFELRKSNIPSFVLKEITSGVERFWYAKIDYNLNFTNSDLIGTHQCTPQIGCCARLSPLSDSEGGCSKVRHYARFIELYPWITYGYETFNVKVSTLMVAQCQHFVLYAKPRNKD